MRLFGRHLHSQISVPLLLASLTVGVVATVVAVAILGRVVEKWIDQSARAAAATMESRIEGRAEDMQRGIKLIAENPRFAEALRSDDTGSIAAELVLANQSLQADNLMLLDDDGTVIASTGTLGLAPGASPLTEAVRSLSQPSSGHPVIVVLGGSYTLTALQPAKASEGDAHSLVMSEVIDESFLTDVDGGLEAAVVVLDATGEPIAASVPDAFGTAELGPSLATRMPEIDAAIEAAGAGDKRSRGFEVGGEGYRVAVRALALERDPAGSEAYLATIVRTDVAADTKRTTTNLILMWSAVAVLVLGGLNWWVARRVSDPLAALSESVARVADGDFSAKVDITGLSEVSDLAEGFNQMTDSLRERSESLTKKVLELATLYEMSRSLGSTLDLDVLLDSVLDSAMRIFNVELGYVAMVDRETGALEVRAWRGADASRADENAVRSSMSEWVVREGRPLIFNPPREGGGPGRSDAVSGALAALCVPLLSAEGTIGAMTVGSRDVAHRFTSDDVRLLATIANHVTIAVGNIELFSSLQEAYLATVRALAAAVDAKDPYTRGHSDGVARYALEIADQMALSPDQRIALEMAAYLHDIGKIGISEDILLKPGKLTDAEMSQMRHHPLIGANILKPVAFPWPIAPIVRHHHEHYDGNGYPAGLKGEEIPILARVLTVADAYEAMVSDRPYRRGRSQQEAILELRRCMATHFDPRVVEAFVEVLEREEAAGSIESGAGTEIGAEETQAVFVAVCDGMFTSFRRLGGPRLATNLERTINECFYDERVPIALQAGHLVIEERDELTDEELATYLQAAVRLISEHIEHASGAGLADHFLSEALSALPDRMRRHAEQLGFQSAT